MVGHHTFSTTAVSEFMFVQLVLIYCILLRCYVPGGYVLHVALQRNEDWLVQDINFAWLHAEHLLIPRNKLSGSAKGWGPLSPDPTWGLQLVQRARSKCFRKSCRIKTELLGVASSWVRYASYDQGKDGDDEKSGKKLLEFDSWGIWQMSHRQNKVKMDPKWLKMPKHSTI